MAGDVIWIISSLNGYGLKGKFPIPGETETGSINDNRIHLNFAI